MDERTQEDIFSRVEELFTKKIVGSRGIHRGYLNRKWIVSFADHTSVFIKQYHPNRFDKKKLAHVETALSVQKEAYKKGVRCPNVYVYDGRYLLTSRLDHVFTVSDIMEGEVISQREATPAQMFSLGRAIGQMHQVFNRIFSTTLYWKPTQESIYQQWQIQMRLAEERHPSDPVLSMLNKQKEILDRLDFSIFDACRRGWTHWDCYLDNFLFAIDQLTAILDFDRLRYAYPDLDVARAILSGSFQEPNTMDYENVTAFCKGYQEHILGYTPEDFARAFRLLWTEESKRWFTANLEMRDANPQRFAKEIHWVQENWDQLEDIFKGIFRY